MIAAILCALGSELRAQPPPRSGSSIYPDSSNTAETLLRNADNHVKNGQWNEAVGIYLRVIQEFGETLCQVPKTDPLSDPESGSTLYLDVRQYCQRRIASMPPEGRAAYSAKVDAQVELKFRRGVERRDEVLLRGVVNESYCSSWGDDALERLGDLAFQDGRFAEAVDHYRRLRPGGATENGHPDPSVDLAAVAAKLLVCQAAQGYLRIPDDLDAYRKAYPDAKGKLLGRDGLFADSLAAAFKEDDWAPDRHPDHRWPTFAGSPSRNTIAPDSVDVGVGAFQWKVPLEQKLTNTASSFDAPRFNRGAFRPGGAPSPKAVLPYHPILLGDQVVICDERRVVAYSLNGPTADPTAPPGADAAEAGAIPLFWKHEHASGLSGPTTTGYPGAPPRFTLTAHNGRIFARLGPTRSIVANQFSRTPASVIAALDVRSSEGKLVWKKPASEIPLQKRVEDGPNFLAGFEGTPVADDQGVYVALTEGGGGPMNQAHVACLDPDTGAVKWARFLFQANTAFGNPMMAGFGGMNMMGAADGVTELNHRLLSLDGGSLYYQTNMGALAALETTTGRIRWIATYPRGGGDQNPSSRDLNPAVVHDGKVLIAPSDSDAIFAFDAASGKLLWRTPKTLPIGDIQHLLGVAHGKLVATGNRVYLFDVETGKLAIRWPDGGNGYKGHGRGVLAGEEIYWPTSTEIRVLSQETGLQTRPPIKLSEMYQTTGGNLAVGEGFLVVAQEDMLVVYCQNRRLIQKYRQVIAAAPEDARGHYRLGQVLERDGEDAEALESFAQAIRVAEPADLVDGRPLRDEARARRSQLLVKTAKAAAGQGRWPEAIQRYAEAVDEAETPRMKMDALLRLAEAQQLGSQPGPAVATYQRILDDSVLRDIPVTADDQRIVRADLVVSQRLGDLLKAHGRTLYVEQDRQASKLFEDGKKSDDPRLLEQIERRFPLAEIGPAALEALARIHERQSRWDAAAAVYKRLWTGAGEADLRGRALLGLARSLEAMQYWLSARDVYQRVLTEYAAVPAPEWLDSGGRTLWALAENRLSRAPFDHLVAESAAPRPRLPLGRRWSRSWPKPNQPLPAEGVPPSPVLSRLVLKADGAIRVLDPTSGEPGWSFPVGGTPLGVGYLSDRVAVATRDLVYALDPGTGHSAWAWPSDPSRDPGQRRGGRDPFARRDGDGSDSLSGAGEDSAIRAVWFGQDKVLALRGPRELAMLDGTTGTADWSFQRSRGRLHARVFYGAGRVVAQVREPNSIVVLDARSGRLLWELPQTDSDSAWLRDPLPLDDTRLALVEDRQTVSLLDLNAKRESWSVKVSASLPNLGPPLLIGDAGRLLVLIDGRTLARLDATTGSIAWSTPVGEENLSERPGAFALEPDAERLYVVSEALLQGLDLADGSVLWVRRLSGADDGWRLALVEGGVAAFPDPDRVGQGAAWANAREFPLAICRAESGTLVQRFVFPPARTWAVRFQADGALVATDAGAWSLGQISTPSKE